MLGVGIEMGEIGLVAAAGAGAGVTAAEASAPLEGRASIGFSTGFAAATGEGGAWDLREKVREKAFPRVDFFFSSMLVSCSKKKKKKKKKKMNEGKDEGNEANDKRV
jgi:hypothetical protein